MRGTALHKAMEEFIARYPGDLPEDAAAKLGDIADAVFAKAGIPKAALAVWRPRFQGAAQGFMTVERERRGGIARSFVEKKGTLTFASTGGDFTLSCQADRIDIRHDGNAAIVDYKSGDPPSKTQVNVLLSPQLPLEAAILAQGGFEGVGKYPTEELIYLSLADGKKASRPVEIEDVPDLTRKAAEKLAQRVAFFDNEDTPYVSHVIPLSKRSVGDYDHLARVREWSVFGGEES
jgi:ATP-dependent helicase/nuclease subunit B